MPVSIPSGRPEFSGFPVFYESDIAPYLEAKEKERRAAVTNFFILVGAVSALSVSLFSFAPFGDQNLQVAAIVGALGAAGATWLLNRTRSDIAHGLIMRVCEKFGFAYRRQFERPAYHQSFRSLRLLPEHNRESWEDEVKGVHDGAGFTFCETHLKYKTSGKNSSTRTVFHGQLFVLDYPKAFLGTTVVRRDRSVLNSFGKPGQGFSRVGLASPEFEKAFEAWSTDQVEARDLLDPVVLERFQELERLFGGKSLRAAFDGGKLLIAIESGDRLNMGSMFKSLMDPARIETLLKEFDVIFDLIDIAVKRVDGRMAGAFSLDQIKR